MTMWRNNGTYTNGGPRVIHITTDCYLPYDGCLRRRNVNAACHVNVNEGPRRDRWTRYDVHFLREVPE